MSELRVDLRGYRTAWRVRARELLGRRGWAVWDEGYGWGGPDALGYATEAVVRVAELLGVGVCVAVADRLLCGRRYRSPTTREAAFAKTYLTSDVLAEARIDEGSRVARHLGIAFVVGRVVKVGGPISAPLLVHELVHVAQFGQWGWAYVAKALWSQYRGTGYYYSAAEPPHRLNAEQRAARVEDQARRALGIPPRWVRS